MPKFNKNFEKFQKPRSKVLSFFLFQKNRHFAAKTVSGVEFKMVQTLTIINCKNENAHHPQEGFLLTYSDKKTSGKKY